MKLVKFIEGQYNKAFVLSMNTGEELIAKLPNPNAGPAYFTTASEVATRHFVCTWIGQEIPDIGNTNITGRSANSWAFLYLVFMRGQLSL